MKKKMLAILAVCLIWSMLISPLRAAEQETLTILEVENDTDQTQTKQPALSLYAKAAVLMDAASGRILYEKEAHTPMPMASTTKIMTLILTLEQADIEDIAEVSAYAASMPEVKLHVRAGEKYYVKDLLYSLMLESHNDSAVVIAEHVGGSVEAFVALMNEKAVQIGCENTCFITPNGLDATAEYEAEDGSLMTREHSTTAADLARILSYCITQSPAREKFLEITRTPSYSFTDTEGRRSFSCTNHNAFLTMMQGALTGKTGFTGKAGYCYTGALQRDERTYVVALLACGWPNHKTYKWSDTRALMEYGLENYTYRSLLTEPLPEDALSPIPIENGQTERLGESAYITIEARESEDSKEGILMRSSESVEVRLIKEETLAAPVYKGMAVGRAEYYIDGEKWRSVELLAAQDVHAIDYKWCFEKVFAKWLF